MYLTIFKGCHNNDNLYLHIYNLIGILTCKFNVLWEKEPMFYHVTFDIEPQHFVSIFTDKSTIY